MFLSIFPKAKAHPKDKKEKGSEARFVSKPYKPEIKFFDTEADLIEIVCNNTYSPFIFNEYRREADFVYTDLIVFDIDEGMTIEEAEEVVHKLDISCLCLPTTSHTEEHHKFRLLFPLAMSIRNKEDYRATYAKLSENFPVDPACSDLARFYYGSRLSSGWWYESALLVPSIGSVSPKKVLNKRIKSKGNVIVGDSIKDLTIALYGTPKDKIPDTIAYFLEHAVDNLQGETYIRANSFLFTCGLLDLEEERIEEVFYELYQHEVTTKVEYMVSKARKEGREAREEEI